MERLRVEGHLEAVCAGGDAHGAQDIVGAAYAYGLAVKGGRPSRVVDLRDNGYGRRACGGGVDEVVGLVGDEPDAGRRVGRSEAVGLAQRTAEALVGHGVRAQVSLLERVHLGLGAVHIGEAMGEPCIAEGPGIEHRDAAVVLHGQDEVLAIEHVDDGADGVAVYLRQVAVGLQHLHGLLHRRRQS